MNLLSVKRELEQLKARARTRQGSGCVCEYVEIIQDEPVTVEQQRFLNKNRECYERNQERSAHVGFSTIIVPA